MGWNTAFRRTGPAEAGTTTGGPIPDYQLQLPGSRRVQAATAVAGAVGTFVIFAVSLGLARALARPSPVPGPDKKE